MTTKKTLVEYGKVSMKRVYCEECQADTFLRNGCTVCCGRYYAEPGGTKLGFKRECDSSTEKRYVHPAVKKEILESQHHRCFYCDSDLNGYAHKNGAVFKMSTVFDHVVPWAWLHNNAKNNIVASCRVCNGIKAAHMFATLLECKEYISMKRHGKGYDF